MKLGAPLMSLFAAGTLGHALIYRRTRRGTSAYRHFRPTQPNTLAQQNHHILFGLLAARWNHFNAAERDYWIPAAQAARVTPYNAYLAYNLRRLNPAQPDDLIAWWTSIIPSGSVLHDLTANRYDGEFVNLNPANAWPEVARRRGHVIAFDGVGYVNVPDPPSVTTPYSLACWFKQTTHVNLASLMDTGHVQNWNFGFFTGGVLAFVHRQRWAFTAPIWATDFDWHHLAGTWDGEEIHIYVDGVHVDDQDNAPAPAGQATLWIGQRGVAHADVPFHGLIDDLRIYRRYLDQPAVTELAAR